MEKNKLNKVIGRRIIELRKRIGLTGPSKLARVCGKDRQQIHQYEMGAKNMTIYTLYELANALDVTLSELFEGIKKEKDEKK